MGTFQKYSACAQWVLGGQIASELTMNSPCTHWVNAPSPPVGVAWDEWKEAFLRELQEEERISDLVH